MKLSPSCIVEIEVHKIKKDVYNQLLTELAEIIYGLIGSSKKSISAVTGARGIKSSNTKPSLKE